MTTICPPLATGDSSRLQRVAAAPQRRILHLLDSRGFGGIESYVANLAAAQKAAGMAVAVRLYVDHRGAGAAHPLAAALAAPGVPLAYGRGFADLVKTCAVNRPLLHTHGYKAGIIGRIVARSLGLAVVSTFHAGERARGRVGLWQRLDEVTSRLATASAVSAAIAGRLPRPAALTPCPMPPAGQTADPRSHIVAFAGRLVAEKGADRFIALAARLAPRHPQLRFVLWGDGPLRRPLETMAETAGLSTEQLHFAGAVPSMAPIWPQVGLLCIPSRAEGLPMVALEAMAAGVPVAAMAVGDLPALLGDVPAHAGWCVPDGDVDSLGTSIADWTDLGLQDRIALSVRVRRRLSAQHDPQLCLALIGAAYRAAEDHGRRGARHV